MAKIFYTDIDLRGNQLQSAVFHKLAGTPNNPVEGQVYYNSETKLSYQYIGEIDSQPTWVPLTGSIQDLTKNSNKVVTSVSSQHGVATLGTTGVQELVLGVGLQNIGTTSAQSLQAVAETIDVAIDNRIKRDGTWSTDDKIMLSKGTNGATASEFSIQSTSLNPSSNDEIPTSKAISAYIGSLAGGLDYKGTLNWESGSDTEPTVNRKTLPTEGVKNGDVWVVQKSTDSTHHYNGSEDAHVGDLYVASVSNGTITWEKIPISFEVEDKHIAKLAPQDGLQTIAIIDGLQVTLGVQAITKNGTVQGEGAAGNVIDDIVFDGNNVATISTKKVLQSVSVTGEQGVVYEVKSSDDGKELVVLQMSLQTDEPENLQYVKGLSQDQHGKISIVAGRFDQVVDNTTGQHKDSAPSTEAVKNYVDNTINSLDTSATIVTKDSNGLVYLQQVVTEEDGKIKIAENATALVLQKVASSAQAEDVNVPADSGIGSGSATNVLESLQSLQSALNNLGESVVNSIQGVDGDITIGNGLQMDETNKVLSAKIKSNDYVTVNGADGIQLDANKIDNSYDTANNTKLATVESLQVAIGGLDVNEGAIALQTVSSGTTTIKIKGIYEQDGKISLQDTVGNTGAQEWKLKGDYNASTNQIALQSTITDVIGTLDAEVSIVNSGSYTPQTTGEEAGWKFDFLQSTQVDGKLTQSNVAEGTIYITGEPTAADPVIRKSDLDNSEADAIVAKAVTSPALSEASSGVGYCVWNIPVTGTGSEAWMDNIMVELRDFSNNIVEADISYSSLNSENNIVVTVNGPSYNPGHFKIVVMTKSKYSVGQ